MKIYTATPLAVLKETDKDYDFFCRDMGLTCYGLRDHGVESSVVMLDFPRAKQHPDIIRVTLKLMESADWWAQLELDVVVLGAWGAPRYAPIAKAIKESGAKLIVRCDYGDAYSQWQVSLSWAFLRNYFAPRYQEKGAVYSFFTSLIKTPIFYFPWVYEKKVIEHLSYADLIMNETPESVRLLKVLLCRYQRPDIAAKVRYVPHPVSGDMSCAGNIDKEKRIICVGRWDNYSKNSSLLIRSLIVWLETNSEYEVHVFGGGEEVLHKLLAGTKQDIKDRIHIRGKIPNARLRNEYLKSRILFMPSRSEGSSVAAEEALSCGCSVVGSSRIFCMKNFVSKNSGTLARRYTVNGMAEALGCEVAAWNLGLRSARQIAEEWGREVCMNSVVREILTVCQ